MTTNFSKLALAFTFSFGLPGLAFAQEGGDPPAPPPAPPAAPDPAPPSPAPPAATPSPPPQPSPPRAVAPTTPPSLDPSLAPVETKPPAVEPAKVEPPHDKPGGEYRQVNNHRFLTPVREGFTAFTNSSLLFVQGFGAYQFTAGPANASLLAYSQLFGAQIAIANRVSLDLRAKGLAAIGSDKDSILGLGAAANVVAGGMVKVRFFTIESAGLTVSGGFGANYAHQIQLVPQEFLTALFNQVSQQVAQGRPPNPDFGKAVEAGVHEGDGTQLTPALMIAEGVGPFGIQLAAFPRIQTGTAEQTSMVLDAHVALDFGRITSYFPMALMFEYEPEVLLNPPDPLLPTTLHQFSGGVFYSGRRDFSAGAIFNVDMSDNGQPTSTRISTMIFGGGMTMQYFF